MKIVVENKQVGTIVYEESAWTGKKKITYNGIVLEKVNKTTFRYMENGEEKVAYLRGNFLTGAYLYINDVNVCIIESAKWYEYAMAVFIFAFVIIWGAVPQLVAIVPLVGGAIGGAISGLIAILSLFFMRKVNNIFLKIGIFLIAFAVAFLICFAIGSAIVAAANAIA